MIDDTWFDLPTARARAAAVEWTNDPRRPLVLAALDAGAELGRRLVLSVPSFLEPDPAAAASLRVFERFPDHVLPEVDGAAVDYVDCLPRSINLMSSVDVGMAAQLFMPTVTRTQLSVQSPPTKAIALLLHRTRVMPNHVQHGDAWLPVLAEMPALAFLLSDRNPIQGFLRALDELGAALRDVELGLLRDGGDLDLIERVQAKANRSTLCAADVSIECARDVLDRIPDAFGRGRGVIVQGPDVSCVHTRFPARCVHARGRHVIELTRDGAILVDRDNRVLWSSIARAVFEREGMRYEYVARDISDAISEW